MSPNMFQIDAISDTELKLMFYSNTSIITQHYN